MPLTTARYHRADGNLASTVKGKGVSFMEKNIGWHAGALSKEDMEKAMAEVDVACAEARSAS
jgi:transketolase